MCVLQKLHPVPVSITWLSPLLLNRFFDGLASKWVTLRNNKYTDNGYFTCASSKWPQRLNPWELKRVIIGEFQWTQSSLFPDFDWRIVKWAKLSWAEPPAGRRKHSSTCLLSSALQSTMCSQHKLQSIMWLCSQQIAVYSVLQSTHNVHCAVNNV